MRTLLAVIAACAALYGAPSGAQPVCTSDVQCADGNVCNGAERCVGGVCQPGTPLQCADASPCTIDTCDPLFGCQRGPVVNGTSCSDGNACNGSEVCRNGACQAGTPPGEGAACNTGNPCTNNDVCRGGVCVAGTIRPDGAGCSDGNACNGSETCQRGLCTPGVPAADGTSCGDGEPCNGIDSCRNGACVTGTRPAEGSACSDGFVCNGAESCRSGVCTPGLPPADGTSCSDGKPCNGDEACAAGICRGGTPLACDDGNACTTDSCDNAAGGCRNVARPNGARCSDTNPCNGQETCQGGQCAPGAPPPNGELCEDANPCNGVEFCRNQACVPGSPRPDGSSCADANVCNGLERCEGGVCQGGTPLGCSDGNPCTADSCDPSTGCRHVPLFDGASCDDRNACNGNETCQQGACTRGAAPACGALVCDPFAGCVVDTPIGGRKLLLRAGRRGGGVDMKVQTREQIATSAPPSSGTAADPVLHGGVVRLRSVSGGFDERFELPRGNWSYLRAPEENRGFRYRDRSRTAGIRGVIVKDGRLTKILGASEVAGLAVDPDPVDVTLILGNQRYCMRFGGQTRFEESRRFIAFDAQAPGACPP